MKLNYLSQKTVNVPLVYFKLNLHYKRRYGKNEGIHSNPENSPAARSGCRFLMQGRFRYPFLIHFSIHNWWYKPTEHTLRLGSQASPSNRITTLYIFLYIVQAPSHVWILVPSSKAVHRGHKYPSSILFSLPKQVAMSVQGSSLAVTHSHASVCGSAACSFSDGWERGIGLSGYLLHVVGGLAELRHALVLGELFKLEGGIGRMSQSRSGRCTGRKQDAFPPTYAHTRVLPPLPGAPYTSL